MAKQPTSPEKAHPISKPDEVTVSYANVVLTIPVAGARISTDHDAEYDSRTGDDYSDLQEKLEALFDARFKKIFNKAVAAQSEQPFKVEYLEGGETFEAEPDDSVEPARLMTQDIVSISHGRIVLEFRMAGAKLIADHDIASANSPETHEFYSDITDTLRDYFKRGVEDLMQSIQEQGSETPVLRRAEPQPRRQ